MHEDVVESYLYLFMLNFCEFPSLLFRVGSGSREVDKQDASSPETRWIDINLEILCSVDGTTLTRFLRGTHNHRVMGKFAKPDRGPSGRGIV